MAIHDKKIISIFPGSRKSEITVLLPIQLKFIKLMNNKYPDYFFIFHSTEENKKLIINYFDNADLKNIDVISDENIKTQILSKSVFAVCKSGTASLQVCNENVASIIVYKLSFINFMIFKLLVNVKFANIINIINDREVIPELLQNECNAEEIYKSVIYFLKNPEYMNKQINDCKKTLEGIRSKTSSSSEAASILNKYLVS
jgi:lipid-A-disaccharide synthase